jgi:hypothetical protein
VLPAKADNIGKGRTTVKMLDKLDLYLSELV